MLKKDKSLADLPQIQNKSYIFAHNSQQQFFNKSKRSMEIKLSLGEKILSMVNSGLGILVVLLTNLFKPELFDYALIFAIILIGITIIGLAIKIATQSKKLHAQEEMIQNLEENQRIIEQDLAKKDERIALLERLMNVPFFKKWNLLYTFMWRNAISFLNNPVNIFEIHVTRILVGTGKLKDNNVSYIFSGESIGRVKSFKFCIAGAGNIPLEKIHFHVIDLTHNQELEYSVLKNTQDSNIKYVEIHFREALLSGDVFNFELKWQWPKTAFYKSDYFSIPNIYSKGTKRIILDLYPTNDMKLNSVETFKFGLYDSEPQQVDYIYMNKDGFYRSIIDNPEKDADYITYYE